MIEFIDTLNYWLALGTILLQGVTVYLLAEHFFLKKKYLTPYIQRYGMWVVAGVGVVSVILTLVYSEVFGFVPCGLCWLQRVFLYPLPLLAVLALWYRARSLPDRFAADFGIVLAVLGGTIALYQHYLQMGGAALVTCPVAGVGADCARRILFEFGYITFPLMSFSVFAFIATVLVLYRARR